MFSWLANDPIQNIDFRMLNKIVLNSKWTCNWLCWTNIEVVNPQYMLHILRPSMNDQNSWKILLKRILARHHKYVGSMICFLALTAQFGFLLDGFLRPTQTTTQVEMVDLADKQFPMVFKICLTPGFNDTEIQNAGYANLVNYFEGRSSFNNSLFGWGGHTNSSSESLGSVKGIKFQTLSRIVIIFYLNFRLV